MRDRRSDRVAYLTPAMRDRRPADPPVETPTMIRCPTCSVDRYYTSFLTNGGTVAKSCRNCRRTLAAERRARPTPGEKVGKTLCPECDRWLDNDHFWNRERRLSTKKCGDCLRKRRMGRPAKLAKKGRWRQHMRSVDEFWEAQARLHP